MMHTRTENDGSIVFDIPYPIWEQLMNQGKEVKIAVPSQPMFDSSEQKTSGSTTTSSHPLLVLSRSRPRSEIKI